MTAALVSRGDLLARIMDDLDRTGQAWQTADFPYDGPVFEAREAVFLRLREWNEQHGERS